jgi:hypothetical protein
MPGPSPDRLVGRWAIARELDDRTSGQAGRFSGELIITADDAGFAWHEQGTLTWGGQARAATRDLTIRSTDDGWWVCFTDGRPFHPLLVDVPLVHPCGADTYRGRIESPTDAELIITWTVSGPAKDQLIISRLTRS